MLKLIQTKDGSFTLLNADLNVHYHSIFGALQESRHVFINNGLEFKYNLSLQELYILEIGFGTGLNALLTYIFSKKKKLK